MTNRSLFIKFMGDSPTVRILDYFLTERELDFSITDIAENAGVGRATLYRIWDDLIDNQVIIPTRQIGKARLFKLNTKNPKIQKLIDIDDMLIIEDVKQRNQKRKMTVPTKSVQKKILIH